MLCVIGIALGALCKCIFQNSLGRRVELVGGGGGNKFDLTSRPLGTPEILS